jgi:hypothetical protein
MCWHALCSGRLDSGTKASRVLCLCLLFVCFETYTESMTVAVMFTSDSTTIAVTIAVQSSTTTSYVTTTTAAT